MNKRLIITVGAFILIGIGSLIAIRYAKGYRPNLQKKQITPTGLLVANSFPNGASVYLNDKLTTATDNTLHLPPGDYLVKIVKDGFLEWQKNLQVKKELVVQTNAELFKNAPDLQSLTSTGAINPLPSPDGLKLAYAVASASASKKNGLWVLDMQDRTISFSSNSKQIAPQSQKFDFTKAGLLWTPDSRQILAVFPNDNVLLDVDSFTSIDDYKDVTAQLPILIKEWQEEIDLKKQEELIKLPLQLQEIATASAKLVFFSPDEEKMLYTATASATLAENLIPEVPASNTQPEDRNLEPDRVYVYDLLEDKNFYIKDSFEPNSESIPSNLAQLPPKLANLQEQYSPLFFETIQWYPTSRHLILTEEGTIKIQEYDNSNKVVVYDGPFNRNFVFPWPGGSKLMVLTNLNQNLPFLSNLYGVGIK